MAIDTKFAYGRISSFLSNAIAARVLVLGLYNPEQAKYGNITVPNKLAFPDKGEVFAPNLRNDLPSVNEGDYICFCCEQSQQYQPGYDKAKYIIPAGGYVKLCGRYGQFLLQKEYTDDELRKQQNIDISGNWLYFRREITGKPYILGPLKNDNGLLVPRIGTEIYASEENDGDILFCDPEKGVGILREGFEDSRTKAFPIDCMTDERLIKWFKQNTTNYDPETRTAIAEIINHKDASDDRLTAGRWERIKKKLGDLCFISDHLSELRFLEPFQEAIRQNIDQFAADEEKIIIGKLQAEASEKRVAVEREIEAERTEKHAAIEKELEERRKEIENLEKSIARFKKDQEDATIELESQKQLLEKLQKTKDKLIEDIKLEAGLGLLGGTPSVQWCYPLEEIRPSLKAEGVSIVDWESMLHNLLDIYNRENNGIAKLKTEKFVHVEDIKHGVRIAKAFGNTIYQLCQPSPKWISFYEFWCESLKPIWESAHRNPAVWHFLLIENFNLALPECWGKPLWNLIEKKTRLLPCAKNPEYPGNLRIIVSAAPTESDDNTHLGLPTQLITAENKVIIPDFRLDEDEVVNFLANFYCGISNE